MSRAPVRTRIAPSPTGFLHLGTARTALYSWAYARHHGGKFILRIEDTDVARSTQESVDQIIASMHWLGLDADEGPVFQMQRLQRYRAVAERMVADGTAYRCYCTPEELDQMREAQRARGEKTRYDGRWRPEPGKTLPPVPEGIAPVIRLRNPPHGEVTWNDLVKGPITISNREIDDLIIMRTDGVPTYNFAVVVDDFDMRISHVFRGDEHVNNTPWQINIFNAIGAPLPVFAHVPIILGDDGQKLSKRRGAVSVTAYEEAGYLPEAMLNYLARLGWSHGDEELFSRAQLVEWFDGEHLSKSPAQWDAAKLNWVNAHYIKQSGDDALAGLVATQLQRRGIEARGDERLARLCALFKDRCSTTVELADWVSMYFGDVAPGADDVAAHVTPAVGPALASLADRLRTVEWNKAAIAAAVKETLAEHKVKMPQLAPAVRVLVCGRVQTPSIDTVLELFERDVVTARLQRPV
ncbi:glutamate--tRNA ligase [Piscinibacter koreensis]|uniref:Glutamate--tRNA ligase n=1 Tax=Piscinibacter koreensis TaxID=2742824 RepID=A0A7Y6NL81_9BURK|nr:glutamate--tRNA ligase [Schlegelella koreensis]NUZ05190.1 glutamate--tRNA ligase [Schlegelella koreensis]